jgi:hypothetical protein
MLTTRKAELSLVPHRFVKLEFQARWTLAQGSNKVHPVNLVNLENPVYSMPWAKLGQDEQDLQD